MKQNNNINSKSNNKKNKNILEETFCKKLFNFNIDKNIVDIVEEKILSKNLTIIKNSIHKLIYGMYIITTKQNDIINGQTANTVFQLTSEPIKLAICLNNNNYTTELIKESKKVAVHVMGQDSFDILSKFGFESGRNTNKFDKYIYKIEKNLPLLKKNALNIIICYVSYFFNLGTHTLFLINPIDAFINNNKKNISTISYEEFRTLKKENILKFNFKNKKIISNKKFNEYICQICGYIYNENIEKEIFSKLLNTYKCPICNAKKDKFILKI